MLLQAITTKYIGPTNFRGSCIKAKAAAGSVMVPYTHSFSVELNHMNAAKQLAEKFGWGGRWYGGGMPDGRGNVYVCTDEKAGVSCAAFSTKTKG